METGVDVQAVHKKREQKAEAQPAEQGIEKDLEKFHEYQTTTSARSGSNRAVDRPRRMA